MGLRHNIALVHVDLSHTKIGHVESLEHLERLHTLDLVTSQSALRTNISSLPARMPLLALTCFLSVRQTLA